MTKGDSINEDSTEGIIISVRDEKEKLALHDFKSLVVDLKQDDETLLRFLRAREHNLQKAEQMLRKSIAWRVEKNMDSFLHYEIAQELKEDMIWSWTGKDNEGRPVMWLPMGRWNGRALIEKGFKEDMVHFVYNLLEVLMQKRRDSKVSQVTFIYGMEELTMWKVASIETLQVLYAAFQDLEQNYPEIIKTIYVINAPWAFSVAFNFIKPILSAHTVSKFKIFSSDKSKWQPVLLANMPKTSIPSEYFE